MTDPIQVPRHHPSIMRPSHLISLFLVLSPCVFFSLATASTVSRGLNGDECTTAANCKASRTCHYLPLDSPSSFGPCDRRDPCYCGPQDITDLICSSDADCPVPGEVCANFVGFGASGCVSLAAVKKHPELSLAEQHFVPNVLPAPEDEPADVPPPADDDNPFIPPHTEQLPFETDAPLDDLEMHIWPSPEETDQPEQPEQSQQVSQFPESEGIQGVAGTDGSDPSPSPESQAACIALHHLQHLPVERLVFPTHVRARVLCDPHQNCATPGHVVQFDGRPMMMKSYCTLVTCTTSVRLVNSPKYERRVRISSRSSRLVFTAFAARYESGVEERLLSAAVRMGL